MNNMKRAIMQAMAAQAEVERSRKAEVGRQHLISAVASETRAKRLRKGSEARVRLEYNAAANRVRASNVGVV